MVRVISKAALQRDYPPALTVEAVMANNRVLMVAGNVQEFGATLSNDSDFAYRWFKRQQQEVDAGRDHEPLLYLPLYSSVSDSSMPRMVSIYRTQPGGVIFDAIHEGGEVVFVTVGNQHTAIPIKHFAVGLDYQDYFKFDELWNIPLVERESGTAYNALLNYIHFAPFLLYDYPQTHQTSAITGFDDIQNVLLTLEEAATAARTDKRNPRRGKYALLLSSADETRVIRALNDKQSDFRSSVVNDIDCVIVYDGWEGIRGTKRTTYPGIEPETAYLINLDFKEQNHQSYERDPLRARYGMEAPGRLNLAETVMDTSFGVYCNPLASTQKISLP